MNPFHRENLRAMQYAVTDGGAGESIRFDNGSELRAIVQPTSTGNKLVPGGTSDENFTTIQVVPDDAISIGVAPSQNVRYYPNGPNAGFIRMKISDPIIKTPSYWEIRLEPLLKRGSPAGGVPGLS